MDNDKRKSSAFELLRAVWDRRKWVAIVAFVVPMTGAMTVAASLPDIYESSAMVIVQHKSDSPTGAPDTRELEAHLHSLSQANLSRLRLEELITRLDLYPEMSERASMETVVARLRRDVKIDLQDIEQVWGRSTVALNVSYRGANSEQAAHVANELASFYLRENQKQRERDSAKRLASLEQQLEQLRARLGEEEGRIRGFKEKNLHELPEQVEVNLASISRLVDDLTRSRERRRELEETKKRLSQEFADLSGNTPVGGVEETSTRIARLTRELRDLRSRYTEHHPDVVRVKGELASLSSGRPVKSPHDKSEAGFGGASGSARERLAAVLRKTDAEIGQLEREQRSIEARLNAHQSQIYNAPRREQELNAMLPGYETTRTQYNRLLAAYSDARLQKSTGGGVAGEPFEIVDPAAPSRVPAAPNRLRLVLIGLIGSFMLALVGVVAAEQRDTSFHSLDELRDFTRAPVLVSVPRIVTPADVRRSRQRQVAVAVLLGAALVGVAGGAFAYAHDNQELVWSLSKGRS